MGGGARSVGGVAQSVLDQREEEARVEIVVREGELGETVAAAVGQLRSSTLLVSLHDKSFLYRPPSPYAGVSCLGCRALAVRQ